jgi:hypothetical protein
MYLDLKIQAILQKGPWSEFLNPAIWKGNYINHNITCKISKKHFCYVLIPLDSVLCTDMMVCIVMLDSGTISSTIHHYF